MVRFAQFAAFVSKSNTAAVLITISIVANRNHSMDESWPSKCDLNGNDEQIGSIAAWQHADEREQRVAERRYRLFVYRVARHHNKH